MVNTPIAMGGGNSRELTGTTSGCTAHHTPVRWRLCAVKQLELIPGPLCWKWRNSRGYLICHKIMDLGLASVTTGTR